MAKNVIRQVKAQIAHPDQKDCVIILTNLGALHTKRLHAKILRESAVEKIEVAVASAVISSGGNKVEIEKLLDSNKTIEAQEGDLRKFYDQTVCCCLNIDVTKQEVQNKTDPILKNFYHSVASDVASHVGIDPEKLKTVDARIVQIPSTQVAAKSVGTAQDVAVGAKR